MCTVVVVAVLTEGCSLALSYYVIAVRTVCIHSKHHQGWLALGS